MRIFRVALIVVLALPAFGQSVVDEAKTKIEKQKHEAMVCYAKSLLEQKAEVEAKLAEIDGKLARLAKGEDVKIDSAYGLTSSGPIYYSGTTTLGMTLSPACCN